MGWTNEHLTGLLPEIITPLDTATAKEQLEARYAHGGGYRTLNGFTLTLYPDLTMVLTYPEDPPFRSVAECFLPHTQELCVLFEPASLLAIVQADGTYAVTRVD